MANKRVLKQGYLTKAPDLERGGGALKRWRRRWFVLNDDGEAIYYENDKLSKQLGTFNMMDCVSVTDAEARMGQPLCLAIELPGRTYYIKADDKETLRGWKKAFSAFVEVPRSLSVVSRPSDEVCQTEGESREGRSSLRRSIAIHGKRPSPSRNSPQPVRPEAVENGSNKSEDGSHGNKEGSTHAVQVSGKGGKVADSVLVEQTELEYWKAECREVNEKLCFLQKQLLRGRSGSFTSQVEGAEEGGGELERTRGLLSGVQSELAAREKELESARQEVEELRSKVRDGVEALACREREWQSQREGLQEELEMLRCLAKDERRDQSAAGEVEPSVRVSQLEREVQQQCSRASALEREVARLKSQLVATATAHQARVEELEQALQQEGEGGGRQKVAELLRRVDGLQQEKEKALADLAAIKKARKALASGSAVSSDGSTSPVPPRSPSTGLVSASPDVGALSHIPSLALPKKSEPSVGVAKVEFVPVFAGSVGAFDEEASRLLKSRAQHKEPRVAPREYLEPWQVEHPNLQPIPLMADMPSPKSDHPSQEVLDKLFRKPTGPALTAASSLLKRLRPVNAASS